VPLPVSLDTSWGLDHGTWAVLCHVYPHANVPIVQFSIDETQPASFHFEIGRKLAPLREEGVLIVGSGNLVHNLHTYVWGRHVPDPYDWAVRFETLAREMMLAGDFKPLIEYDRLRTRGNAFDSNTGSLSSTALCARDQAGTRTDHTPRRRCRWRIDIDVGSTRRPTVIAWSSRRRQTDEAPSNNGCTGAQDFILSLLRVS
jgi:hypothetical protein